MDSANCFAVHKAAAAAVAGVVVVVVFAIDAVAIVIVAFFTTSAPLAKLSLGCSWPNANINNRLKSK